MENLRRLIREVPDFPKPGINFYDITTLLQDPEGLRNTIEALYGLVADEKVDTVIGVESRGFIFATPLAVRLKPVLFRSASRTSCRPKRSRFRYDLEYGQDTLEMHRDAVGEGHRVLIVDDLLATGGTARAVVDLVEGLGGKVVGLLFVVELDFLHGRNKFDGYRVESLIKYES